MGGSTIEELLENMSVQEFMVWERYVNKMGPLDPRLRMDRSIAVLVSRLSGGKMVDYMPWPREDTLEEREDAMPEATPEMLMALVRGKTVDSSVVEGTMGRTGRKWRRKV